MVQGLGAALELRSWRPRGPMAVGWYGLAILEVVDLCGLQWAYLFSHTPVIWTGNGMKWAEMA